MSLIDKLEKRLLAGKFRLINEKLYKNSKTKIDDSLLAAYHAGFQSQAEKWPERPLDLIKDKLKNTQLIVDMGCGEAELATCFEFVISLDLHPTNSHAMQCNMNSVPLRKKSVDAVVFCLSLMTMDASVPIREANRILRKGGRLLIAEVASRIRNIREFIGQVEKTGFKSLKTYTNKYFVLAEFEKTGSMDDASHEIALRPWVYKKR
jgi:ribosomal RNA-processing protein 8